MESLKHVEQQAKGLISYNVTRIILRYVSPRLSLLCTLGNIVLNMISALHPRGPPLRRWLRWLPGLGRRLARDSGPPRFRHRTGRCTRSHSGSRARGIAGVRRGRVRSLLHAGRRGTAGRQLLRHPGSSWLRKSELLRRTRTRALSARANVITH